MTLYRHWWTVAVLLVVSLLFTAAASAGNPPGHWSFPGDIATHLRQGHGQQTAGLTYQQMLNLHDQLHRSSLQRKVYRPTYRFRLFRR